MKEISVRKIFLEEFTKQLIINSTEERESFEIPQASPAQLSEDFIDTIHWGKISQLITDPMFESIECLGPDQNLVLKSNNQDIRAAFALSKEEIMDIIIELQTKTRPTMNENIMQTETDMVYVTADLSEFQGDRFIIQKKSAS